ncbi:MAG TPA: MOSC domain-containing protein [Bryobacteraceae bacterium]|nr:MOSC domain-containing protein [Bryobacteraceae bacterium]
MTTTTSVVSIQVGRPRQVSWRRRSFRTGILKTPVSGPVAVTRLNLAGDEQADLSVHGGLDKAVYVYPSEHYEFWRAKLDRNDLAWGSFGENLTTTGLDEREIAVGDQLGIGSALFEVRQPRTPCHKLAFKFDRPDIIKAFWKAGRSGFYLSVLEEGVIQAGDKIIVRPAAHPRITIAQLLALLREATVDLDLVRRAIECETLPEAWKVSLRERFSEATIH